MRNAYLLIVDGFCVGLTIIYITLPGLQFNFFRYVSGSIPTGVDKKYTIKRAGFLRNYESIMKINDEEMRFLSRMGLRFVSFS